MNYEQKIIEAFLKYDSDDIEQSYLDIVELEENFPLFTTEIKYLFYNTLGYISVAKKLFSVALEAYDNYLDLAYKNKDNSCIHIGLHQKAMVYREMNHYDEAMYYIQKERRVIDEHFEEDALRLSANLYEEGYIGMLKGNDVEDTKHIMMCALKYAKISKDETSIACSYRGLGEIYGRAHNYEKAHESLNYAKKYFIKVGHAGAIQEIDDLLEKYAIK